MAKVELDDAYQECVSGIEALCAFEFKELQADNKVAGAVFE